ncbi:MAG TPA: signal peptidase II [Polyangiales bacterium]|jgi:signal peptidase II|nr:signal peptidase II [Polyangiales bacterium]
MSDAPATPAQPPRQRRTPLAFALCLAGLALCTWADLGSKSWAVDRLSSAPHTTASDVCIADDAGRVFMQRIPKQPIVWVDGYLELRYAENCGAAFGLLDRGPSWVRLALFAPAAIAATLGLLWLFYTGYGGQLFAWSVPLIASGALGNLIDRARLGYVVDFIRFHLHDKWAWPTFNVADSTITVGVALLLIEGFLMPRAATKADTATSNPASAKT